MPEGNWIRSSRLSTHHMPSGASSAIGIASDQRTGSITRSSNSISGIDDSRKPRGSSAKENAVRQAITSNGLVQRVFSQRDAKVTLPSVRAENMIEAENRHIRMPV